MISVSPRPQNADCIGDYNSNKPNDVRESEIHTEMSTSVADGHNREDVGRQTVESTAKVLPWKDSSVVRRAPKQQKPPSLYETWVTD